MSHKAHEGYSGKNPVPKVALKSIFNNRAATESKAKTVGRDKQQDSKSGTSDGILKGAEVQVKVRVGFSMYKICGCMHELGSGDG